MCGLLNQTGLNIYLLVKYGTFTESVVKLLKSRWWNATFPHFPPLPLPSSLPPLPSFFPFPPVPFPPLPSLLLEVGPLNPAKGSGDRYKLPSDPAEI